MPDRSKTLSNEKSSREDAVTKNSDIDVVRQLGNLHISKTTKLPKPPNLPFKTAKNSRILMEFHEDVCKLVWTHLAHIRKPSIAHIEIEMKFGIITDKKTRRRIIHSNKPSVVQNCRGRLVSNVSSEMFLKFQDFLPLNPNSMDTTALNTVQQTHTYTKDSIYSVNDLSKTDRLASWRCSEDLKNKGSKRTFIKKTRVKDFLIHYPHSSLDAKISISLEIPQIETLAVFRSNSVLQRYKDRSTYRFGNEIPLHLDMTRVITKRSGSSHQSTTHEVEIEMDPVFKKTVSTNDKESFDEYMNSFLHTSDLIRERLNGKGHKKHERC
ncbi:hypothetical protein SEUBUCD646_0M03170 [Saccharomyces eubayanus]|uniref:mRNA-capping enzyme subunit beta n=2 Tax=Saccharomyces TaxID=4930 RepID=A0A6C1EF20_SACPS|nr:hypothetical protein GRS66_009990 [Saccharomyces pastorianus]CAI1644429.1 hypothetical protein SEUBUCD650_0M03110 [Saccharomyces eubayanus]CAI1673589.1 hypothetical protein SEUBUCD646_0M03170 [Saccharomyces eubayanus]